MYSDFPTLVWGIQTDNVCLYLKVKLLVGSAHMTNQVLTQLCSVKHRYMGTLTLKEPVIVEVYSYYTPTNFLRAEYIGVTLLAGRYFVPIQS